MCAQEQSLKLAKRGQNRRQILRHSDRDCLREQAKQVIASNRRVSLEMRGSGHLRPCQRGRINAFQAGATSEDCPKNKMHTDGTQILGDFRNATALRNGLQRVTQRVKCLIINV